MTYPLTSHRLLFSVVAVLGALAPAAGWEWVSELPFQGITVTASSEDGPRWSALRTIDGCTDEPQGLWQTRRDNPKSAWLLLTLSEPADLCGVSIFHQVEPRYYRSLDYAISCLVAGEWREVARVTGNRKSGWREHPFAPLQAEAVRIDISRSEYGYRMGLNEVRLVYTQATTGEPAERVSPAYHCGPVVDMGIITWQADLPEGTALELRTQTAPDEDGRPGEWTDWSAAYTHSGSPVAGPSGEWVRFRSIETSARGVRPLLQRVTIGSPRCAAGVSPDSVLPLPGDPLALRVWFRERMDAASAVSCELVLPDRDPVALDGGRWYPTQRSWGLPGSALGDCEGVATVRVSGARRSDGLQMMEEEFPLVIGATSVLGRLAQIAEWTMANESSAIFVEGYNERTLLALYEITGEERYLDHVRKWVQKLLAIQKPEGYWGTGYGDVYFADTGSALGLLINFYKFATPDEQAAIDASLERYLNLLLVKGDSTGRPFIHADGSVGVGYSTDKAGNITKDRNKPYTIATGLTGAEICAAWYYIKGDPHFRDIAIRACDWMLNTMVKASEPDPWAAPGQFPYIIEDYSPGRSNREELWRQWPYDTSAYVGEGFIAAWTYIDDEAFRADLGRRVRPHIRWLLDTQNADGSWAVMGSGDHSRSHGVVNLLLWYYENLQADPRIALALQRYCALLLDPERSAYLQIPGDAIATSLAGRALVEIVRPGVDCYRWKDAAD